MAALPRSAIRLLSPPSLRLACRLCDASKGAACSDEVRLPTCPLPATAPSEEAVAAATGAPDQAGGADSGGGGAGGSADSGGGSSTGAIVGGVVGGVAAVAVAAAALLLLARRRRRRQRQERELPFYAPDDEVRCVLCCGLLWSAAIQSAALVWAERRSVPAHQRTVKE